MTRHAHTLHMNTTVQEHSWTEYAGHLSSNILQ